MKKNELNIIQENVQQCVFLIENSFLKGIFTDSITDVSYNGNDLFIQDNYKGRYKYEKKVNEDDVYELIKLISNYMLKNFSVQNQKQYNSVTIEKRKNKFSSRNLIINIFCIFISIVMIALLILILYYFIVTKQKYDVSSILTILKSWH